MSRFAVLTDAAIALVAELGMRGLTHRAVDTRAGLPPGTTSAYFRTRKALIEALVRRLADLDRADLEQNALPAGNPPAADPGPAGNPPAARSAPGDDPPAANSARGDALPAADSAPGDDRDPDAAAFPHRLGADDRDPDAAAFQDRLRPEDLDRLAAQIAAVLDRWLTAGRTRTLARYACLLEATHHPELRTILEYGAASRAQARTLLAAAGAADPRQAGDHLVACVDGLLFDRLAGAGALTAPEPGTPENRADLTVAVRTLLTATTLTGTTLPAVRTR